MNQKRDRRINEACKWHETGSAVLDSAGKCKECDACGHSENQMGCFIGWDGPEYQKWGTNDSGLVHEINAMLKA